jgi:two-component system NtrC family sensor kinase
MNRVGHTTSIAPGISDPIGKPAATAQDQPVYDQPAYDLTRFTLADMVRCGAALRRLATESTSMEDAAQRVTRYLYENLREKTANCNRSCVLVRFFKTHLYGRLIEELREAAEVSSAPLTKDTNCLTLLATAGDEPQWNSRRSSKHHRCIPLTSEAMVDQFPMISQLIRQMGMTTTDLLRTTPEIIKDLNQKNFGVFHVPAALNSPFVPAQKDFVVPYGIASVLGFGGVLPDGELFAVIIFARVAIPTPTAEMFRTIALNLKLGLLAILGKPVFAG